MIGAGPTGLIVSQLLKCNGASKVVLVANAGRKMDLAEQIGAADEYVALIRDNPQPQWDEIKSKYPHGFDVVVRASLGYVLLE